VLTPVLLAFAFGSILTLSSTVPFDWRGMYATFTV
jgi:hypothetical protein